MGLHIGVWRLNYIIDLGDRSSNKNVCIALFKVLYSLNRSHSLKIIIHVPPDLVKPMTNK